MFYSLIFSYYHTFVSLSTFFTKKVVLSCFNIGQLIPRLIIGVFFSIFSLVFRREVPANSSASRPVLNIWDSLVVNGCVAVHLPFTMSRICYCCKGRTVGDFFSFFRSFVFSPFPILFFFSKRKNTFSFVGFIFFPF